ncbi:MAG: tail fiber domain-containing protein [Candidatus Aminicenantes bacterium]|jgi:hypothetical protein
MKSKTVLSFVLLVFIFSGSSASEKGLIAVSPGRDAGIAVVGESCPTFSWTAVEWAKRYKVEVFEAFNNEVLSHEDMSVRANLILSKEIQGRALSWTPSSDEQLNSEGMYVWYVQAKDSYGTAEWSEGRIFMIKLEDKLMRVIDNVVETLKANGVSKDVIDKIISDIIPDSKEGNIDTKVSQTGGYRTQDKIRIQEWDAWGNTWYGEEAGLSLFWGDWNSLFGKDAGRNVSDGSGNTCIGYYAGRENSLGDGNTFVGEMAGWKSTGNGNVAIGSGAGINLNGDSNTIIGNAAGSQSDSGSYNVYIGGRAGSRNAVDNNTFVGYSSGYANATGIQNTFIGYRSGETNETGINNTFVGYQAGLNTTASHNTFLGRSTGETNTTGHSNTFLGHSAGYYNDTGQDGTFVGRAAGYNNDADNNTFIGYFTGYNNTSGNGNVFIGHNVGYNETGSNKLYIDNSNTSSPLIFGDFSSDVVAINGKLGIGTDAPGFDLEIETTGKNAAFFLDRKDGAKTVLTSRSNMAALGTLTNHPLVFAIDAAWKMKLNTDNSLLMSSGASCTAAGVWTDASSRVYKENIHELTIHEARDALSELNPVRYNYKIDREEDYLGFIAEDVPELVASKDRKGMSPMDVVAVLTKVVQEQQDTITELQERIAKLENKSQ